VYLAMTAVSISPDRSLLGWQPRGWLWLGVLAALTVLLALLLVAWWWVPNRSQLIRLSANREWDRLEIMAARRLWLFPNDWETRLLWGESRQRAGRLSEAIAAYQTIPVTSGEPGIAAGLSAASLLSYLGRLDEADRLLQSRSSVAADHRLYSEACVTAFTLTGRRWESQSHLQRVVLESGADRLTHLIYLANLEEMPAPPEDVFARMYQVGDGLGCLGAARVAAALGRADQAFGLVQRALRQRPDVTEAYVLLGSRFLDRGEVALFDALQAELPADADTHPGIWFLRGRRAHEANQLREAMRCYAEVLSRHPNHDQATYQLAQLLAATGRKAEAAPFLVRAGRLTELIEISVDLYEDRTKLDLLWRGAQLLFDLGRLPEAAAWCEVLLEADPTDAEPLAMLTTLRRSWSEQPPWLLPEQRLIDQLAWRDLPLPSHPATPAAVAALQAMLRSGAASSESVSNDELAHVAEAEWSPRFRDVAAEQGLDFRYVNGDDPTSEGRRMFEYTGGGVAAIDYDRDGWTDLFLTQGSTWPPNRDQREALDTLYRNRHGMQAEDVSATAGVQDPGFGQGACAADFNLDGFTDLYIGNIDGNRLLQNNGDGTFTDVTEFAGIGHREWTTSCLIADLNADGFPDLYDVTFLTGDDVFTRICRGEDGVARSCAPAGFLAANDVLYISQGDGRFVDRTAGSGLDVPDGDGLGIVVADFDQSGQISLFIANDGRPNFAFRQLSAAGEMVPRWQEEAMLTGLALDEVGAAQACMGVAAGDFNNDRLIDLFVTNFYHEANTLYVNLGDRIFADRSRSTGLRDPSWELLGFGTQFVDLDSDGWEDLLVANGHVDHFEHKQIPYRMRPQCFLNSGGRFTEILSSELGEYFHQPRLGRGLAKLDWNRDSRIDIAVSHLEDPVALVLNETSPRGTFVQLELVGQRLSRDAFGARVRVTDGEQTWERQLTAGDGYQASNERLLHFGMAAEIGQVTLDVIWPGGQTQTFDRVVTGQRYLLREGDSQLMPMSSIGAPSTGFESVQSQSAGRQASGPGASLSSPVLAPPGSAKSS
jgi:tetratricopeptide (TPR) repeat protein